jgi:hypothetical protein
MGWGERYGIGADEDSGTPFGCVGVGRRGAAVYAGTRSSGAGSAHLSDLALALLPAVGYEWSDMVVDSRTKIFWVG